MNKSLQISLFVLVGLIIAAGLVFGGIAIGSMSWFSSARMPGYGWMHGGITLDNDDWDGYPTRPRGSMMDYDNGDDFSEDYCYGNSERSYEPHGGAGWGHHGGAGWDHHGGFHECGKGYTSSSEDFPMLSLDEAEEAVHEYIEALGIEGLEIGEIMIFSNHAYAQIIETETGIGAMEVLVDPVSKEVYPEHGPNMMWNLKYGMHHHGGWGEGDFSAEMTFSPAEAVAKAQEYLDRAFPGYQADSHADPFYGYFTLHILEDGEVFGMLSVNGFTGEVFLHTWHGEFIEMIHEEAHD